ncbi:TIGR03086 family metal-binding protein [Nocardioides sp. GXZ039]|uniref:TIGR03086 family metal-binding protein n=1 Tax=Nocardioides sp. GXZ039 TaxID=3136018 RepID=UPI0030F48E0D
MTTDTDLQPTLALLAAAAQAGALIDRVTEADLDRPTPCEGWTLRDLLAHLVAVADRVPHMLRGGHPFDLPSQTYVTDNAWSEAWAARQPEFAAAVTEDGLLERTVQHPAGPMPAPGAILGYASELCTHAWDVAATLGDTSGLDDDLAAPLLDGVRRFLPAEIRESPDIPFAAVVDVPEDAPATERLVAWYGRDPRWAPARV